MGEVYEAKDLELGENVAVNRTTLIGVRLASQSMGYLTVLGPVISEPMKIKLLGTSSEPTITATFLDNGVYWFTSALVAMLGIVCLPLNSRSWCNLPLDTSYSCACFCCVRHYTSQPHPCGRCARVWQARSFLALTRRKM